MPLFRALHRLTRHQCWEVGIVLQPVQAFLDPNFCPAVAWMPTRGNLLFRADPFVINTGEKFLILYEDFDYRTNVGRISAAEFDGDQFRVLRQDILPVDCHLAYPFVLEHEGRWLCIPETHQRNEITVWEVDTNSLVMTQVATLLTGFPAVDTTVFRHQGRWWLACTRRDELPNQKLFLWHADDLFGPWEPHRGNPVKSDASCTRPAGTPFTHQGQLFRPTQDCSARYGSAVVFNRVVQLTPDNFEEESFRRIDPVADSAYNCGIHTIASCGSVTVVDGLRYTFLAREAARLTKAGLSALRSRGSHSPHAAGAGPRSVGASRHD